MKILHTSDWHLGLEFFGMDPTTDQQHMIGEIVRIAREQQAGAVIVAGDIFDRAVVAPDAIALYNDAMRALCLELGLPVVLIAGNHDGAARLSTLSDLLRGAGDMKMFTVANLVNLCIRVVVAVLFAPRFGIAMVWYAVPIGWFANWAISFAQYRTGKWRKKAVAAQP